MSNLKKTILAAILLFTTFFYAQHRPDKDKIKSLKVAFITERLDLGTKEAQAFWPLYNEYEQKRKALRRKERTEIRGKIKDADGLSENEANDLLNKYLSLEEEEKELDKDFLKGVSKVVSAKKTLLLLRAEEEFKRQLIRQYRHKKGSK